MNEEKWLKRAEQELRRSSDELSPEIRERLLSARRKAMDALTDPHSRGRCVLWPSLAALAAGVVISFSLALLQSPGPAPDGFDPIAADDFELIANSENLQMLDELEFYQWLDEVEWNAG